MSAPFVSAAANPAVLWMLCILGLSVRMLVRPAEKAAPRIILMILVLAFEPFSVAVMNAENHAIPLKFDYYLYLIDKGLGLSSFWVARSFSEGQRSALLLSYQSLSAMMVAWYGVNLLSRDGRPRRLLSAYLITFILGPCLYLMVPACGPRHAFGSAFPDADPSVLPVMLSCNCWPNAMPSLHLATALLLVFFAGRNLLLRAIAWVYLAATVAATLAFEHYVIDLVVAVPFACFAIAAAGARVAPALANLAVAVAWLGSIRFYIPGLIAHPAALKALALGTLGIAVISLSSGHEHGWPGAFRWRPGRPAAVVAPRSAPMLPGADGRPAQCRQPITNRPAASRCSAPKPMKRMGWLPALPLGSPNALLPGGRTNKMQTLFLKGYLKLQCLADEFIRDQSGQDLIEYALVVALIALAATAGMGTVAKAINTAFTSIGTKLTTYTS